MAFHTLLCSLSPTSQYFSLIILLFLSEFIVGALVFVFRSGISRAITMDIKDGIVKHYNGTDRGGKSSVKSMLQRLMPATDPA